MHYVRLYLYLLRFGTEKKNEATTKWDEKSRVRKCAICIRAKEYKERAGI